MNTRTYSRSSVLAFPKTCAYACAVERPSGETPAWWAAVVCIASVTALIVWVTR